MLSQFICLPVVLREFCSLSVHRRKVKSLKRCFQRKNHSLHKKGLVHPHHQSSTCHFPVLLTKGSKSQGPVCRIFHCVVISFSAPFLYPVDVLKHCSFAMLLEHGVWFSFYTLLIFFLYPANFFNQFTVLFISQTRSLLEHGH